jgi:type II secretion system protein I
MPKDKGFTLLEVAVALCILAMFLVPLLGAVSGGMRNIERARNLQTARQLAMSKLEEIKLTAIPDAEQEIDGDFSPQHPDYQYKIIFTKNPELLLLETQVNGLKTMEVHLFVIWTEGNAARSLEFQTLLAT